MEHQGLFVTIESICGIRRGRFMTDLKQSLDKQYACVDTVVPVPTPQASKFSGYLEAVKRFGFYQEAPVISRYMLDLAIQEDTLHNAVLPLLNKGHVVICDQFYDGTHSKYVHGYQQQLAGKHNGQLFVDQEFPSKQPDLTFVLDIEPLQALASTLSAESNVMFSDSALTEFLVRTRAGLIKRAESFPDRIKLLDASLPNEQIIQQATAYVHDKTR